MMNANLILQGRSPNIVNALAQATQAAGAANQVQHQNALRNLYAENGAGLVSNDPNAVNALAGLDPQAALGIQGHHSQEARATRNEGRADRQLDMQERRLSAEEARQVEAHKQRIGAQAAAQEAEQAERVLFDAALLAQQGDLHGVNKILMDAELTPVPLNDLNQFPILASKSKAVLDALKSVDGMGGQEKAPAAVQALQFRAQAAGLQPGTPEYANFMLDGGRKQDISQSLDVRTLADGFNYYIDPTGQTPPRRVAPDVELKSGPLSPAGKLATDLKNGDISHEQYDAATTKAPLVDMSNMFGGPSGDTIAPAATGEAPPPSGAQEAFGFQGLAKNTVNSITDFVGAGEVFENAGEQTRFFQNMEEDLLVGLSQAYGRQPAQALMERLRKLVPNAGTLEGSSKAQGEIQAMKKRFQRDLRIAEGVMGTAKTPASASEAVNKVMGLRAALSTLDEAGKRFQPEGTEGQTQSGIKFKVLE